MAISRRAFLRRVAGVGALGTVGALDHTLVGLPALAEEGQPRPVGMAMHVHSSFSEGTASMAAQLDQARTNAAEVVWWTDHDWRMLGHGYRRVVHFTGLTETEAGNDPLTWTQSRTGSLSSSSVAISTARSSVTDPVGTSSMRIAATGTSSSFATMRATADASASRENLRGSLSGQSFVVDVFPEAVGSKAFLEIRVKLSNQPASGGRAAGAYMLFYRVGGPDAPGVRRVAGLSGYVGVAAPAGTWTTLTLRPTDDIAALWPDLVAGDTAMREISFAAGSKGKAPAVIYVDHLRFERTTQADAPLAAQQQIMGELRLRYPEVVQHQGSEVSLLTPHVNWFGSGFSLPDYTGLPLVPPDDPVTTAILASRIHDVGGLSSLNHPFGSGSQGQHSSTKQDSLRRALATKLMANRAFGVDIIEAGYTSRSGVNLGGHTALWDTMSRNAIFLTGTGVNDNHGGTWFGQANSFMTWAWAIDATEPSLLSALVAGRVWFADQAWRGTIDLLADSIAPMGSASVSALDAHELTIMVTQIPVAGSIRVLQGPVDHAGTAAPDPGTVSTVIPGIDLAGGSLSIPVVTTSAAFVRVEVLDGGGTVRASSNPIWFLRGEPPHGVPPARAVV